MLYSFYTDLTEFVQAYILFITYLNCAILYIYVYIYIFNGIKGDWGTTLYETGSYLLGTISIYFVENSIAVAIYVKIRRSKFP